MSNFICDKCGTECVDSPRGYVTGCEHYPADVREIPEAEKQQIINAINAAIDAITQYEWYYDTNNPCSKIPDDIRDGLRGVLKENKLLTHNAELRRADD